MPERANLAALAQVPLGTFEGHVWRAVLRRHRERLLSTEGNRYFDGRFHRAGETGVLYTSLEAPTAAEEVSRHAAPEMLAEGLSSGIIRVALKKVLDLTQEAALARLGLSKEMLTGSDYLPTQALSFHARRLGIQGIIVPSATGRGSNLVIFEDNLGEGCSIAVEGIG